MKYSQGRSMLCFGGYTPWLRRSILGASFAAFAIFSTSAMHAQSAGGSSTPACMVTIPAGASIQNAIDSHSGGTVFCLAAGTWHQQYLSRVLSNDAFIGDPGGGTILSGDNSTIGVYTNAEATGVLWQNITVEYYNTSSPECNLGAIHGAVNWTFVNDTFTLNNCTGLNVGSGDTVIGGHYTYNAHAGIETYNNANITVNGAEVAWNNTRGDNPTGDAGGFKFSKASNVQLLNNWVHDNAGNGMWCDIGSVNVTFDGNTIINNAFEGIKYEISTIATIRNNVVNGNGAGAPDGFADDQIGVYTSDHVQVYDNNVETLGKQDTIIVQTDYRPDAPWARVQDDAIYNNTVTFATKLGGYGFRNDGGAIGPDGLGSITSSANIFWAVSKSDPHWFWNQYTPATGIDAYQAHSGQDSISALFTGNGSVPGCQQANCTGAGMP